MIFTNQKGFKCQENDCDPDLGKATLVPLTIGAGKAPLMHGCTWMHQVRYVLTTAYYSGWWELSSSGTSIARRRPVSTWIFARLKCKRAKMKQRNTLSSTRPHCLKVVSGCFGQKQQLSTKSTKTRANKKACVIWAEAKRTKPGGEGVWHAEACDLLWSSTVS